MKIIIPIHCFKTYYHTQVLECEQQQQQQTFDWYSGANVPFHFKQTTFYYAVQLKKHSAGVGRPSTFIITVGLYI